MENALISYYDSAYALLNVRHMLVMLQAERDTLATRFSRLAFLHRELCSALRFNEHTLPGGYYDRGQASLQHKVVEVLHDMAGHELRIHNLDYALLELSNRSDHLERQTEEKLAAMKAVNTPIGEDRITEIKSEEAYNDNGNNGNVTKGSAKDKLGTEPEATSKARCKSCTGTDNHSATHDIGFEGTPGNNQGEKVNSRIGEIKNFGPVAPIV